MVLSGCRVLRSWPARVPTLAASLVLATGPGAAQEDRADPPAPPRGEAAGAVERADERCAEEGPVGEDPVLGSRSAIGLDAGQRETEAVAAGTPLRARPDPRAPVLVLVDPAAELPVVERRQAWARVRYQTWTGWVAVGDPAAAGSTRLPAAAPARPAPQRLELARELLGAAGREGRLGPYRLLTDVGDRALLAALEAAAGGLEAVYRQRYRLQPASASGETIVLFDAEATYRRFEGGSAALAGLGTLGHMSPGLTATFAAGRSTDEIRRLLVHELTHLLNARALGPGAPAWLEEGLAEDLAYGRFDRRGRLLTGTLGGASRLFESGPRGPTVLQQTGGHDALAALLRAWDDPERPSLALLVELPWQEFVDPRGRKLRYALSAFLVRYLLDAHDGQRTAPFLNYLATVAAAPAAAPPLWPTLGLDPRALETDLRPWLDDLAAANGVLLPELAPAAS